MKLFTRARLKLTGWYLLAFMSLSIIFSLAVYRLQVSELISFQHRIETRFTPPELAPRFKLTIDNELVEESQKRLLLRLGIINGSIFIITGFFSYLLAGKALAPLEQAMSKQQRFVSDASHELCTPLTSLRTSLEVFLRQKKATLKESRSLIEDNLTEVKRLQTLTTSLLTLSHSVSNQPYTLIKLDELVNEVVIRLTPLAKAKKIKLSPSLDSVQIKGNRDQLSELITILLDNAIKYTPTKKSSSIIITLRTKGNTALLTIQDHGIGISRTDLPQIFDRFYRVDTSRSYGVGESGGYGLGLSIAKQIVDSHGLSLDITSQLKKGTTVKVGFSV